MVSTEVRTTDKFRQMLGRAHAAPHQKSGYVSPSSTCPVWSLTRSRCSKAEQTPRSADRGYGQPDTTDKEKQEIAFTQLQAKKKNVSHQARCAHQNTACHEKEGG